jgi:hypothetical protein
LVDLWRAGRFSKENRPPSPPPNPYALFARKRFQEGEKPKSLDECRARITSTAHEWNSLSFIERQVCHLFCDTSYRYLGSEKCVQPYQDDFNALLVEYHKKRLEYYKTVDPRFLRAYNKYRRRSGKTIVHRPRSESPKPMTGFFRCMMLSIYLLGANADAGPGSCPSSGRHPRHRLLLLCTRVVRT